MTDIEEPVADDINEINEGEEEVDYFGEELGGVDGMEDEEELEAEEPPEVVKLFGKWSFTGIEVRDISLEDYIACKGDHATFLPHTAGRYQMKRFRKASCPIVERLACCLMRKGRNAGQKLMAC